MPSIMIFCEKSVDRLTADKLRFKEEFSSLFSGIAECCDEYDWDFSLLKETFEVLEDEILMVSENKLVNFSSEFENDSLEIIGESIEEVKLKGAKGKKIGSTLKKTKFVYIVNYRIEDLEGLTWVYFLTFASMIALKGDGILCIDKNEWYSIIRGGSDFFLNNLFE